MDSFSNAILDNMDPHGGNKIRLSDNQRVMRHYLRSLVSQRANEGGNYCLITVMDC